MKIRISMPGADGVPQIGGVIVADWEQGTEAAGRRSCGIGTGSGIGERSLSRSGKTGG